MLNTHQITSKSKLPYIASNVKNDDDAIHDSWR